MTETVHPYFPIRSTTLYHTLGLNHDIHVSPPLSIEEYPHPLHMAVAIGKSPGVIRNLVMMFGVDKQDEQGRTPLMFAVLANKVSAYNWLKSASCCIYVRTPYTHTCTRTHTRIKLYFCGINDILGKTHS